MAKKRIQESTLYPLVEKWMQRRFRCFATGVNRGTKLGRIDVIGLRDIGGNLSGKNEVIAIEVKAGNQPFSTAAGQTFGYSIYAEKCYLADLRAGREPFSEDEIAVASKLGIGLLALRQGGKKIDEILSAPLHEPIERMQLEVVEKLGFSNCTICNSFFQRGDEQNWQRFVQRGDGTARVGVANALKKEKGLLYWVEAVGERQGTNRHRRYICPDCLWYLYRDLIPEE